MELIQELTTKNKISINYTVLKDNSESFIFIIRFNFTCKNR